MVPTQNCDPAHGLVHLTCQAVQARARQVTHNALKQCLNEHGDNLKDI